MRLFFQRWSFAFLLFLFLLLLILIIYLRLFLWLRITFSFEKRKASTIPIVQLFPSFLWNKDIVVIDEQILSQLPLEFTLDIKVIDRSWTLPEHRMLDWYALEFLLKWINFRIPLAIVLLLFWINTHIVEFFYVNIVLIIIRSVSFLFRRWTLYCTGIILNFIKDWFRLIVGYI